MEQSSVFGSVKEVRAEDFVQEVFEIVINYCACEDVHECILIFFLQHQSFLHHLFYNHFFYYYYVGRMRKAQCCGCGAFV